MKFKVGDLVMLSAAGRGVDQNSHAIGGWGIIKEITKHHYQMGTQLKLNGTAESGVTGRKEYALNLTN